MHCFHLSSFHSLSLSIWLRHSSLSSDVFVIALTSCALVRMNLRYKGAECRKPFFEEALHPRPYLSRMRTSCALVPASNTQQHSLCQEDVTTFNMHLKSTQLHVHSHKHTLYADNKPQGSTHTVRHTHRASLPGCWTPARAAGQGSRRCGELLRELEASLYARDQRVNRHRRREEEEVWRAAVLEEGGESTEGRRKLLIMRQ